MKKSMVLVLSLTMLTMVLAAVAAGQTAPSASPPGGGGMDGGGYGGGGPLPAVPEANAAPQKRLKVVFHVDFAWDPNRLPYVDEEAINSLCRLLWINNEMSHRLVLSQSPEFHYRPLDLGKALEGAPGGSTGPARSWWKGGRITVEYVDGLPSLDSRQGHEALQFRPKMLRDLERGTKSWFVEADTLNGLSKPAYDRIREEIKETKKRLEEMNIDERLRQTVRLLADSEVDKAAKKARMQATEAKITEIRRQAEEKMGRDPVILLAEMNLDTRKEAYRAAEEANKDAAGKPLAPDAHLALLREAISKLKEAELQFVQAKETAASRAGGDLLTRLTNEQAMLTIDQAEMDARANLLQKNLFELQGLKRSLESADDVEKARLEQARPWWVAPVPEPEVTDLGAVPRGAGAGPPASAPSAGRP